MEGKSLEYVLCVPSVELKSAIKRAVVGKGKSDNEGSFTIQITTFKSKEQKYRCTLMCSGSGICAVSAFEADLRIIENVEDGTQVTLDGTLKHTVVVTVSSFFAEVIDTFADIEERIFLTLKENIVVVTNTVSQVPIPVKENEIEFINPKSNKLEMVLNRAELSSVLKYVGLAVNTSSGFGNSYGFKPVYQDEAASLCVVGMTAVEVVNSTVDIKKVDNSEYPSICNGFSYAMVDSAKIDQILAVTDSDTIAFIIYYNEGSAGKEVLQVNIKTPLAMYQLKTFVQTYPESVMGVLNKCYESPLYGMTLDAKSLKSALSVLALGCKEDKKVEVHIFKDHVIICDQYALSDQNVDSKEYIRTNIKEVVPVLPEGKEEEVFAIIMQQFLRSIKPYDKKLTIQVSQTLITLSGTNDHVKHGVCPCKDDKVPAEKDNDMNENEDSSSE